MDLDDVPYPMATEGISDGRLDGEFAGCEVGLVRVDDGIGAASIIRQIGDLYMTEEAHHVIIEHRGVHDLGMLEHALLEADTAEEFALGTLGRMVLEVLAEVALRSRLGNLAGDLGELDVDHLVEFF